MKRVIIMAAVSVASLTAGTARAQLSEYGIEGMGVVSTRADEGRASVAPDGRRIVWDSNRGGGAGGRDLWQAVLREGRWADAAPLPINSPADESAPFLSADGRWLYFVSNRPGGHGGGDLYRAAVLAEGGFGPVENLGPGVNTRGDEAAPTLSRDGRRLLFASDGHGGAGGFDLFVARRDESAFVEPRPLPGIDSAQDETDAAWLQDGRALVFARSREAGAAVRLHLAHCRGGAYADVQPLALSFNTAEGRTSGPVVDAGKPSELLVAGSARAPKAGGLDIYRMRAPPADGDGDCLR